MAKKKGKADKRPGAGEKNAPNPAQAELVAVTPATDVAASSHGTDVSSAKSGGQVSSTKQKSELLAASCMEIATTPCTNIEDVLSPQFVDADDSPELWADLANAPCTDITVESSTDIQQNDSGVSDLVAQQLKQMFEEGGATATCATAGSFTGTHTMNLNVKAGAVDMNLSTVT